MAKITMRMRVLFTILPIAIIPIIFVASFSAVRLFGKLKEQGNLFYSTVIKQVANNIDFIYTQYAMSFVDMTNTDNFKAIINKEKFKTLLDEKDFLPRLGEADGNPIGNSITSAAFSKFKGAFLIVDLKKSSLARNTPYYIATFSNSDFVFNIAKLLESDFYKNATSDPKTAQLVYGKPPEGSVSGFEIDKATMFLYPYFLEGETVCSQFMVVIANKDFIPDMYKDIDSLKYGTLYVLDKYNNIIANNHPSKSDYYLYDNEKKRYYMESGDEPYIKEEKMGISDYRNLNTDSAILNVSKIQDIIENVGKDGFFQDQIKTIHDKGVEYLVLAQYAQFAEIKLIYFHPLPHTYGPIYNIIFWIFMISIFVIISIVLVSYYLSNKLNAPITLLSAGSDEISQGNYKSQINTDGFFGEFIDLGKSFNSMAKTINDYSENLEELVKNRTEELNNANKYLKEAYEENKRELLMAQRIQSSLIPKIFPETEHIDFSGMYLPMEALGGDLYDVYKISETRMGIVILDVCGHGVPAALITTMAKISFNGNSKKYDDVTSVMSAVNNELCDAIQGSGDYFTAFYCIVDTQKKTVEYTNAAHNDIYILRKNGKIEELAQTGPVVGVIKDMTYESIILNLDSGDRLVLYTDGVVEARSEDRTLYDTDRFKDVIIAYKDKTPKDFITFLYDDILKFKNNTPHDDDIAILIADMI